MKEIEINKREGFGIETAVDVVILNKENKVLLGKRLVEAGNGLWSFPGGHLRKDETIMNCAKREIEEEIGSQVNIKLSNEIIAVRENSVKPKFTHHVTVIIKGQYISGNINIIEPDKCEDWSWFSLEELPENLFSGVKDTINNLKKRKATVVSDWENIKNK